MPLTNFPFVCFVPVLTDGRVTHRLKPGASSPWPAPTLITFFWAATRLLGSNHLVHLMKSSHYFPQVLSFFPVSPHYRLGCLCVGPSDKLSLILLHFIPQNN